MPDTIKLTIVNNTRNARRICVYKVLVTENETDKHIVIESATIYTAMVYVRTFNKEEQMNTFWFHPDKFYPIESDIYGESDIYDITKMHVLDTGSDITYYLN